MAQLFVILVVVAAGAGLAVWRYLTTRKVLSEKLAAASARQQATLDSAIDAILTINPSGSIESLNRAAERMFGWSSADLDRRSLDVLLEWPSHGDGSFLQQLAGDGSALEQGLVREMVERRRDGSTLPVDVALGAMDLPSGDTSWPWCGTSPSAGAWRA